MILLETHVHKLRFSIDKDAPPIYKKRWNDFKKKCEEGENQYITEQIKNYCKMPINKNLSYLKRSEGGLGGDDNKVNKQIRFRQFWSTDKWSLNDGSVQDDDIVLTEITSTNSEKWTYEELDDLIYGFIKTANYIVQANCVNGLIEMVNKKTFDDYYLCSDCE